MPTKSSKIFDPQRISTVSYTLNTPALEDSSISILVVSDLHSTIYGEGQTGLLDLIRRSNPDLIFLSGDIFDEKILDDGTDMLLRGIQNTAPVFYAIGNHEYMRVDVENLMARLESFGVTVLRDDYREVEVKGNKLIIAGAEDPDKKYFEKMYKQPAAMEAAFRGLDEIEAYKILIAHRPENIKTYRKYSFDLIVSGHAHGGQVIVPHLFNGLYAPGQGIFPRYAGGLYRHGSLIHIVSRGLSLTHPNLPRPFNPPELVIIILEPQ